MRRMVSSPSRRNPTPLSRKQQRCRVTSSPVVCLAARLISIGSNVMSREKDPRICIQNNPHPGRPAVGSFPAVTARKGKQDDASILGTSFMIGEGVQSTNQRRHSFVEEGVEVGFFTDPTVCIGCKACE